jgi:hypothetical protein
MLQRLPGEFVCAQVVTFPMVHGGRAMSVRGLLMKFGSSLM